MGSPAEAFGAFSCDRQDPGAGIGQESEYGGGLLRFWQGRYFVAITASADDQATSGAVLELGKEAVKTPRTAWREAGHGRVPAARGPPAGADELFPQRRQPQQPLFRGQRKSSSGSTARPTVSSGSTGRPAPSQSRSSSSVTPTEPGRAQHASRSWPPTFPRPARRGSPGPIRGSGCRPPSGKIISRVIFEASSEDAAKKLGASVKFPAK